MNTIQTTNRRDTSQARNQLQQGVRWSARRGRLLVSLYAGILCLAVFIGGLFVIALKDVLFVLPQSLRIGLLVILLLGVVLMAIVGMARPWFNRRFNRAAAEQIDHAANAADQPVTLGLSLKEPMDDDALALALLHRAEARAAEVAQSIKPGRVYPWRRLRSPGCWLLLVFGLWLLLALVLPSQAWAIASRVLMPWGGSPPFSRTQLDPLWTPQPPDSGDDVVIRVVPGGKMPPSVDWVRLDEAGKEVERFAMSSDWEGGFSFLLRQVESPIDFRLEAFGRHTRTYSITPTPRPPVERVQPKEIVEQAQPHGGSAAFDADKVARRELDQHPDWPGLKAKLVDLLNQLSKAERRAQQIDPADAQALQGLADKLAELTAKAGAIAEALAAMKGELPAEASALIGQLSIALMQMQAAALPDPPVQSGASLDGHEPNPEQWLQEAADAAEADQQRIGKGMGFSDKRTDSGTSSGNRGEGRPNIRDPSTSGAFTSVNTSGESGPLPDSVMQQVPLSYRDYVSAYFERLSEE